MGAVKIYAQIYLRINLDGTKKLTPRSTGRQLFIRIFCFYMFPVTRSGNTESCCKTHVEQAAQDGQNDGQSEDNREVNILELHACDGALGLEEACVGQ